MAKITRKNATTAIKLSDLLRKRKTTLSKFIVDFGLYSYESLKARCERIGVATPDIETYNKAKGPDIVNSPTDGIIVLEAPKVINEKTEEEFRPNETFIVSLESESQYVILENEPSENSQKKIKNKKNKWNNQELESDEINFNL